MSGVRGQTAVLIVDNDVDVCETIVWAFKPRSVRVESCGCGADAIARARLHRFDLLLTESRLPDMLGLDLIRRLRAVDHELGFVVISGVPTTQLTVDAMKLGAMDVIDKPLRIDLLVTTVMEALEAQSGASARVPTRTRPRSSPERWAMHVLSACDAKGDLKTLDDWASFIGVSYSSLCESCRLLNIRPHAARDLLRLLRALRASSRDHCAPEALLDVSDRRTLDTMLTRAGLVRGASTTTSIGDFLDHQTFVPTDNEGLKVLRELLAANGGAGADQQLRPAPSVRSSRGLPMEPPLYLKPNVQVEPLVDQWYAWSHLIPPATAARNITERHLKIMESYIKAPHVHAAAVKNPRMLGGPFVDYGAERVDDICALRDHTLSARKDLIALSGALADLDAMLASNAKGYSLQGLYPLVPELLRGYVELVYDLNNHPSFRLLEGLLYKSRHYDPSMQSFMLSPISSDDRPFVLSTPRLDSADSYHWRACFRDETVDAVFRLKRDPQPYASIREMVRVPGEAESLFKAFLTPEPPPCYVPYRGPSARWRYFGHACVLVETPSTTMLFDPVLSYTYESNISRYTYLDLPDTIDYVLITHNHQDHVLFETLLQIRHKVRHVVVPRGGGSIQDPSLKLLLHHVGFKSVIELGDMEEIPIENGSVMGLPFMGEHADLDIRTKSAYLVRVGGHSLLFAADSCNIEPRVYEHLHREIGDIDALFLGMECNGAPLTWLYGPLLSQKLDHAMDQSRRLAGSNYDQAVQIVNEFRCSEVYVYAMGQEPWLNYVMSLKYTERSKPIVDSNRLIAYCREHGTAAERLFGEREMFLA